MSDELIQAMAKLNDLLQDVIGNVDRTNRTLGKVIHLLVPECAAESRGASGTDTINIEALNAMVDDAKSRRPVPTNPATLGVGG